MGGTSAGAKPPDPPEASPRKDTRQTVASASLTGTRLARSRLTGTRLTGARLTGTCLTNTTRGAAPGVRYVRGSADGPALASVCRNSSCQKGNSGISRTSGMALHRRGTSKHFQFSLASARERFAGAVISGPGQGHFRVPFVLRLFVGLLGCSYVLLPGLQIQPLTPNKPTDQTSEQTMFTGSFWCCLRSIVRLLV